MSLTERASLLEECQRKLNDLVHNPITDERLKKLWISYMNHIWLVLSLQEAVKDNNFYLYAYSMHTMADLFFSFGGQNYGRYSVWPVS